MATIFVPKEIGKNYGMCTTIVWRGIEYWIEGEDFFGYKNKDTHCKFKVKPTRKGKYLFEIRKIQKEKNCTFKDAKLLYNKQ